MIKPTVGRQLLYHPGPHELDTASGGVPCAATIAFVWDDRTVNLSVISHRGHPVPKERAHLVQPGETPPTDKAYAVWPDFVIQQHHKEINLSQPGKPAKALEA